MDIVESLDINNLWGFIWQTFENASLTYDLALSSNGTKHNNLENNGILENPAKLGIFTGFFLAWIAEIQFFTTKANDNLESKIKNLAILIFNFSCFFILAPIVGLLMVIFFIYRTGIKVLLEISEGTNFVGLLEGSDCVWAIEESNARSVINILAMLEVDSMATAGDNVLSDFQRLINDRLVAANYDKLFWLREKRWGYFFWRKTDRIDVTERVRWLDDDHSECDGSCNDIYGGYLKKLVTRASNQPLPGRHSTSWEILIGKNCSTRCDSSLPAAHGDRLSSENQGKRCIPLLFRVHHTLGDGVALLRLLLEAIADSSSSYTQENDFPTVKTPEFLLKDLPVLKKCSASSGTLRKSISALLKINSLHLIVKAMSEYINLKIRQVRVCDFKEARHVIQTFFNDFLGYLMELMKGVKRTMRVFGQNLITMTMIPTCLVQQALHSIDKSAIQGPPLSGEKIISCWMEDDFKSINKYSSLLTKIRDIKNITGTRFTDVILASLSANLHKYFQNLGEPAPQRVTVVLPARMSASSPKLILKNQFSVGLLPLCIAQVNDITCDCTSDGPSQFLERLRDVSSFSEKLRSDPDYLVNYWVMTWLSALLPEPLLKIILQSRSTMVFSNLPGPRTVSIQGHTVKKIAFWIPHRGTTGIGCSFLTYGGNIHLSLIADKAVISSETRLDEILQGTVRDLEQLHDKITFNKS